MPDSAHSGRDITVQLAEGGKRTVRIGYVAEAPVWKAAYRLTLPAAEEDKARLQGWVVLENMTGNPWKDVAITLSSASPVTFRQALYDPYYVNRPVSAPPVSRIAVAPTDQGQNAVAAPRQEKDSPTGLSLQDGVNKGLVWTSPFGPLRFDYSVPLNKNKAGDRVQEYRFGGGSFADDVNLSKPQEPGSDATENVAGASFTLSMPVSIGSGESLTVPFVDLKLPVQTVAWYRGGRNPWQALTVKNDGATSLPAGSVTVYEATEAGPLFSGEAQFPLLPAGDSRLLGFAADQKVLVDREAGSASTVTSIKAVDGSLHVCGRPPPIASRTVHQTCGTWWSSSRA